MIHDTPLRLGIPVKVLGRPDLKSNDTRRWQNAPHLHVSLDYVDQILDHCAKLGVRMYRMSSDLAPYATHPDMPQFHGMVEESAERLAEVGAKARALDVRLSFHPSQFVLLNAPDDGLVDRSINDLLSQSRMLDLMGMGPEAVVVTHVGGVYEDRAASRERWVRNWDRCPEPVRRRLVLENDDLRFSAADTLWISERTGVRLIFDHQHFWCLHEPDADLVETFAACLATWPEGERPKMHFSSPRTEMRTIERKDRKTGKKVAGQAPPIWTGHADFVQPFEFIRFMRDAAHLEFDVMLEAKRKDEALLRLRTDLARYAPDVAARFGIEAAVRESA
ncbi:UV DNA damage repair endonuclease UvsE [Jannaschia sp. W003]|uniref:UV DNA damage repair endonuclease UvsE n=1 Tax=Jannaschia sp. W003 TaxID=2867012 RepID=UPI0021A5D62B|nr:UV DNA damage repair endonuclease UvsE [Jannaschia sp. W003]UWQ21761.1 UV DNA damage repair endonuclease UvsE [Jannaschia sp. W003]